METLKKVCDRVCVVVKDVDKFSFLEGVEFIKDLLAKQYAIAESPALATCKHKAFNHSLIISFAPLGNLSTFSFSFSLFLSSFGT